MKKQSFAACRHLPTDAIHILDLDLFQNQTMRDGATSLACEYINENSAKDFAVIASGEQDELGVTYIPLSEKENREIMETYFKCRTSIALRWWVELKEVVVVFGEYYFTLRTSDPDHVIATVEFIEPENA